jgi:hypothetical protein
MRLLSAAVAAVAAVVLASGGPALAQVAGQPIAAHGAYTVEPFSPNTTITIQGTGVRLRAEPFTTPQTQVLSSGSTGHVLTVVGIARLPDWNWYQVVLKSGQKAFIRSDLTSAPSRGNVALPMPAPTPITPPTSQPYTPTYVAPTPAPAPPTLGPSQPISPPPVQLAPPVEQPATPSPTNRGSLDLPLPSDPPGLQSH